MKAKKIKIPLKRKQLSQTYAYFKKYRKEHKKQLQLGTIVRGYIFTYKADISEKEKEFLKLQQLKCVPTLSVFSTKNNHRKIDEILAERNTWEHTIEIKYPKYKLDSVKELRQKDLLLTIRKSSHWQVEINIDSLEYTCYTTYNRLKYLRMLYGAKGLLMYIPKRKSSKVYILKKLKDYNHLLSLGKVLIVDPSLRQKCLNIRSHPDRTVEFIYDQALVPKSKTLGKVKRTKHKAQKPFSIKYTFENDPEQQKLVCIATNDADGKIISAKRLPKYKAQKLVDKDINTWFCSKSEYQGFQNTLWQKDVILSTQGDKNNPKDTRNRHTRRNPISKKAMLGGSLMKQQIPGKWVEDPDDENYEVFRPGKLIYTRITKPSYKTREKHNKHYVLNKDRLLNAYKKAFESVERRNNRFSPVETWSTNFMTILTMVKMGKPENTIALYISKCLPGWNDKTIRRFITYLRLTKQGLNYKPNKKTKKLQLYKHVEKKIKRIEVSKLPYREPIAILYNAQRAEGYDFKKGMYEEKLERNVFVLAKRIYKYDTELKENVVVCQLAQLNKWVLERDFTTEKDSPWTSFIKVIPGTRIVTEKIEYHIPKAKPKKKKWRHPIKGVRPEDELPFK